MADDLFNEIDDILGNGGEEDTQGNEGESAPAGKPQDSQDPGNEPSKSDKRFKDFQEHSQQQEERIKDMEKKLKDQQEFIDRVTGRSAIDEDAVKEEKERKKWEEDTPNVAKKLVSETKDDLLVEIKRLRQELNLKDVYKNIMRKYDVDIDRVTPELLPIVDQFSDKAKEENPEAVILNALKIVGKLKERDSSIPYVEDGVGNNNGAAKKALEKEAEMIKSRLFGGNAKGKVKTIFE